MLRLGIISVLNSDTEKSEKFIYRSDKYVSIVNLQAFVLKCRSCTQSDVSARMEGNSKADKTPTVKHFGHAFSKRLM